MKKFRTFFITSIVLSLMTGSASAISVQFIKTHVVQKKGDEIKEDTNAEFFYTGDALRVIAKCDPQTTRKNECSGFLYNGQEKTAYVIDSDRKMAIKITQADIQRLAQMLGPMIKQLWEQMQNPDNQGTPAKPEKKKVTWSFQKTAKTQKIGKYTCIVYEVKKNGQTVAQQCITPYKALGLDQQTLQTLFGDMAGMLNPILSLIPEGLENTDSDDPPNAWLYLLQGKKPPYDGFALRQVSHSPDGSTTVTEVVDAGVKDIPANFFTVPENYKISTVMEALQQLGPALQKPQQP